MAKRDCFRASVFQLQAVAREVLERTNEFMDLAKTMELPENSKNRRYFSDLPLLSAIAKEEYRQRRAREQFFDPALFGEPAWDLLLDLFIQRAAGKAVSISSASVASGVPSTTALRWIGLLEEQKLVRRTACPSDKRVSWVELSEEAFLKVAAALRTRAPSVLLEPIKHAARP